MNTKFNKISSNKIEIEVEIPANQMGIYFDLAASELSKDMKVKGFRSGKVPVEIVEREKGSQKLYENATNFAIQKTLPKAISELSDESQELSEIVGQPEITIIQIARGNPMKYKAVFWIIPEIELSNYKGLKATKKEIKVEDKEIDRSLDYLQKSRAKLITVDRPAKKNDRVEIDFSTRDRGVKVEGGESKNHPIILGEGKFLPGFENELEGMKANEEKKFSLKAPEDWPQKNLAGKTLDFNVKVNLVQERKVPELSDDFAKSLGQFSSLDALKKNIKEGLFKEKKQKEKEKIRIELIEKIAGESKMDIPDTLVEEELNKMIVELKQNVLGMGMELEKYLEHIKKSVEDLKKEWRGQAQKRVRVGLVLKEIAKKEKIEPNEEEVEEKINVILQRFPNVEEAKKQIDLSALREYTKNIIKNEKVFELLEKEAEIIK